MKITFDKFKRLLKESSSSIYDKYEDILCEVFEVDDISEITKPMYDKIINSYQNKTLNSNDSALLEDAEELVIREADKNGYNLIAHHGTPYKFSEFKRGDIGFHFGTLEQAEFRLNTLDSDTGHILNTAISLHNPLVIEDDIGDWEPWAFFENIEITLEDLVEEATWKLNEEDFDFDSILQYKKLYNFIENQIKKPKFKNNKDNLLFKILYYDLKFSLKELINLCKSGYTLQKKSLINRIKSCGYDGIKYLNLYESPDNVRGNDRYSYIVFDANQIKNCEVVSFSNGKIIPLENRFNSSTNNLFETYEEKYN